jgi:hypothetical protein
MSEAENELAIGTDDPTTVVADNMVELSMDDLFKITVDAAAAKKTEEDALLPSGTYTTTPPLTAAPGRTKDGREYVRLFGSIVLGEKTSKLGYSLSWQRRNQRDKEGNDLGKPDNMSLLWANAVTAYKKVYAQEPESIGQVIAYLRDYPHRLVVGRIGTGPNANGSPGNMVFSLSAITA